MDEGRLQACCLSKQEGLDENGVFSDVNLEGVGGPSADDLDN